MLPTGGYTAAFNGRDPYNPSPEDVATENAGVGEAALFISGEWLFSKLLQGSVWAYRALNASRAIKATGQSHHLLGKKIVSALDQHPTLKGAFDYSRENSKYIYNALDEASHRGYQNWHRAYDTKVVNWLQRNTNVTVKDFNKYLHDLHQESWLKDRIPNVNLLD